MLESNFNSLSPVKLMQKLVQRVFRQNLLSKSNFTDIEGGVKKI